MWDDERSLAYGTEVMQRRVCRKARPSLGSRDLMAGLIEIKMLVHACPLDTMRKNLKVIDQWLEVIVRDRHSVIRWRAWPDTAGADAIFLRLLLLFSEHSYLSHQPTPPRSLHNKTPTLPRVLHTRPLLTSTG